MPNSSESSSAALSSRKTAPGASSSAILRINEGDGNRGAWSFRSRMVSSRVINWKISWGVTITSAFSQDEDLLDNHFYGKRKEELNTPEITLMKTNILVEKFHPVPVIIQTLFFFLHNFSLSTSELVLISPVFVSTKINSSPRTVENVASEAASRIWPSWTIFPRYEFLLAPSDMS